MSIRFFSFIIVIITVFTCRLVYAAESGVITPGEASSSHPNWKICRNSELGFQLLYPKDWVIHFPSDSQGAADRAPILIQSCEEANSKLGVSLVPKNSDYGIYIDVCNSDCMKTSIYADVKNLDEYIAKSPSDIRDDPVVHKTSIDGEDAVVLKSGSLIAFHNAQKYVLICLHPGASKDDQKKLDTCNAVRETFKFL